MRKRYNFCWDVLLKCPYASAVEQGMKYNKSHEWVKVEGDTATIGISDFAQVSIASTLL